MGNFNGAINGILMGVYAVVNVDILTIVQQQNRGS